MAALNIRKKFLQVVRMGVWGYSLSKLYLYWRLYGGKALSSDSMVIKGFLGSLQKRALGLRVQPQDFKGLGFRFI